MTVSRATYQRVQRWRSETKGGYKGIRKIKTLAREEIWILKRMDDEMKQVLTQEEIRTAIEMCAKKNGWI